MVNFSANDAYAALIGGAFIALSTSFHLLASGRVTGMSGIFNSLIKFDKATGFQWKVLFLLGLILIPAIAHFADKNSISMMGVNFTFFDSDAIVSNGTNWLAWVLGGLFVGFGTRLGNGCTSGHGVCGLPRFSKRSFAAVCIFITCGMITATARTQIDFLNEGTYFGNDYNDVWGYISVGIMILIFIGAIYVFLINENKADLLAALISGVLFGIGLILSGMCRISKVIGFLTILPDRWDPSLAFVMGSAVAINVITFYFILKRSEPLFTDAFHVPNN